MVFRKLISKFICILILLSPLYVSAEPTAFAYRGHLVKNGTSAKGVYNLRFRLYSTDAGGVPVDGIIITNSVTVSNGVFVTSLDFGNVFDGGQYWLELAVRTNGFGAFTMISPRQPITVVPFAIHAETASSFTGTISDNQVPGTIPRLNNSANSFLGTVVAAGFAGNGSSLSNLPASAITSGIINSARLGFGTANSGTYLRGDGFWSGIATGLLPVNNLNDLSSKWAAAQNVGILDMTSQTHMYGYDAKNNATASFTGQFGVSDWGTENAIFWRSRSTAKGDWYAIMGSSGGGEFVAGDRLSMSTNAVGHNYFWSMGNPALQVYGPYQNRDCQNVAVNCNPYISGSGWLCAMVTTNSHGGSWSLLSTNANGEKIYWNDVFTSYLAVPEQGAEFNLPGFGIIVQNNNDPFALCSCLDIGGVIGNYSYFQTSPYAHELLFPIWKTNAWRSSSNNFVATKLNTLNGCWDYVSNITVNGAIMAGKGTNGTTPNPAAALEVNSTTKGLLLPRMTKAQRDAIASPVAGLSIYQTDNLPGLRVYNGANWVRYSETVD